MKAGIWIDHRRAVIVALSDSGEHISEITSHVEKHPERAGDSPMKGAYEAHQVPADDSRQRALTGELNRYYDSIVAAIRTAERLVLFGPGEAKGELRKRFESAGLGARILAVEPADKMSEGQIAAKVREYFDGARSPQGPRSGRPNAGLQGKTPEQS
jgi:hypothetical protein